MSVRERECVCLRARAARPRRSSFGADDDLVANRLGTFGQISPLRLMQVK